MLRDGVEGTAAKLATGAWAGGGGGLRGGWRTGPVRGGRGIAPSPFEGVVTGAGMAHGTGSCAGEGSSPEGVCRAPAPGSGTDPVLAGREGAGGGVIRAGGMPGGSGTARLRPRSGRGSERAGRGRSVDRGDRRRKRDGAGGARRLHPWPRRGRGVNRAERSLPPRRGPLLVRLWRRGDGRCEGDRARGVRGHAPLAGLEHRRREAGHRHRAADARRRPWVGELRELEAEVLAALPQVVALEVAIVRGTQDVRRAGAGPAGAVTAPREGYGSAPRPVPAPAASAVRTKKREVFPIRSEGGAFHQSSGTEAGAGGSSWNSRGSGTEKRSVPVSGTSRSSSGMLSTSGTEAPRSSRARMLSGSSFSACSNRRRAPSRSPLIFSHSPASSSWLARALTAVWPPVARARPRRARASARADRPSRSGRPGPRPGRRPGPRR